MCDVEVAKLRKERAKAESKNDFASAAGFSNAIGELFANEGRYEEAIAEHENELGLCEALCDHIGMAVAHRKIGEALCDLSQFDDAIKHQELHLKIAKEESSLIEQQRAYATLGRTYLCCAEVTRETANSNAALRKAETAFSDSLAVCNRLDDWDAKEISLMKARLMLNIGLVHEQRNDLRQCAENIGKAIQISKSQGFDEELYRCQLSLSGTYQRNGGLTKALALMESARQSAVKMKKKNDEAEALIQKALIYVELGQSRIAMRCLKKVITMRQIFPAKKKKAKDLLKSAYRIDKYLTQLSSTGPENHAERLSLSEKLGDALVPIGLFKAALKHYNQMLESAEAMGKTGSDLIPVFVSLGQTYADDQQYDKAVQSCLKEVECRGDDHGQVCRTYLNIADAQENGGLEYTAVRESYIRALDHARQAKDKKLQLRVLKSLLVVQNVFKDEEGALLTRDRLASLRGKLGMREGEEEEEDDSQPPEPTDDTQLSDSDVDLDDISDMSGSEDEEYPERSAATAEIITGPRNRAKRFGQVKRNEKGETPLHRACIEGSLKRVQALVDKGHPVHVRDHTGWTPLHEAANHDHVDVVEFLVTRGADINDRGGADCLGVTPLIDAAECGNLDVVRLLVRHGADVHARDDQGSTAYDSLRAYRSRCAADDSLTRDKLAELKAVQGLLKRTMHGDNPHLDTEPSARDPRQEDSEDELPALSRRSRGRRSDTSPRIPRRTPADPVREEEEDSESEFGISLRSGTQDLDRLLDPSTAPMAYQETMRGMGSAASRQPCGSRVAAEGAAVAEDRRALLYEDELFDDDWLIDDVTRPAKRKSNTLDNSLLGQPQRRAKRRRSSDERTQRKASRSHIATQDLDPDDPDALAAIALAADDVMDDELPVLAPLRDLHPKNRDLLTMLTEGTRGGASGGSGFGLSQRRATSSVRSGSSHTPGSHPQLPETVSGASHVMRVRVSILGTTVLVPIITSPEPRTMQWLCEEAASRYHTLHGRRPGLSLTTADGALLTAADLVTAVLANNEQVIGVVDRWEQPPLSVRYTEACQTLEAVMYSNIKEAMTTADDTKTLSLSGLGLRPSLLAPVARALQYQQCIKCIDLQGNRMGDMGMEQLAKALGTLPQLTSVNLASNGMTSKSIATLSDCLSNGDNHEGGATSPRPKLEQLDVSHNPLGDTASVHFISLLSAMPTLTSLKLAGCGLTAKFFQGQRVALAEVMQEHRLQVLDMSYNVLTSLGVELLLSCVNVGCLTRLNLSGVCCTSTDNHVTKLVERHLLKPHCALEGLLMAGCHLHSADDIDVMCRVLPGNNTLQTLSLSACPKLGAADLSQLLSAAERSPLQHFMLRDCNMAGPLSTDVKGSLTFKMGGRWPWESLEFAWNKLSEQDEEFLRELWQGRWKERAQCEFELYWVKLYIS